MDTDLLLDRVAQGESSAAESLLKRHAARLRQMVNLRMDQRLAPRLDPSDVVQDALVEAHRRLRAYAVDRPIPFYPWLRAIAWDKLIEMTRRHITAERRSVLREACPLDLSGDSKMVLVDRIAAVSMSPSEQALRQEVRSRVQLAIDQLPPKDHEVIVLKHLEELSVPEIAAVLDVEQEAVYSRYRHAVQRLHRILSNQ